MKKLDSKLVGEVTYYMQGNRRQKFLDSVRILNESLAQGGWTTRGSVKSKSGFYQGLTSSRSSHPHFGIQMCLSYGSAKYRNISAADIEAANLNSAEKAWIALCLEADEARELLDAARPVPKITAIGLSPKVTKTFQECGLDLDLPSIQMAKIDFYEVQAREYVTRFGVQEYALKFDLDDKPIMERVYFVKWSEGVLFDKSRFADKDCQACGKNIPSGRYVPIEATCKKNGLVALWVGCDCAKNIFGIKDIGISKAAKPAEVP
jgi:hypothetical protein